MKKIVLSLGLVAGMLSAAHAQQGARFGVKAGVSLANITGDGTSNTKNLVGATAGLMADFGFNDLISFHPELLYSQKGVKYEASGLTSKVRLSYLDVPLLLRVKTQGLFFEAGPQVGFLLAQKNEVTLSGYGSSSNSSSDNTRKVDVGYIAGIGYQLPQGLEFGLRYNGGISDLSDQTVNDHKQRNSVFQLQVGYLFGGK